MPERSGSVGRISIGYTWRGAFTSAEVNALHAEGFGCEVSDGEVPDIRAQVEAHSLGWV